MTFQSGGKQNVICKRNTRTALVIFNFYIFKDTNYLWAACIQGIYNGWKLTFCSFWLKKLYLKYKKEMYISFKLLMKKGTTMSHLITIQTADRKLHIAPPILIQNFKYFFYAIFPDVFNKPLNLLWDKKHFFLGQ